MNERSLVDEFIQCVQYIERVDKTGKLDLAQVMLNSPTLFLPLGCYLRKNLSKIDLTKPEEKISNHNLSIVLEDKNYISQKFSYIVGKMLPKTVAKGMELLSQISSVNQDGAEFGGRTTFNYLLAEILGNIYDHSQFEHAWIFMYRDEQAKTAEICFFDDGITIPGSFDAHNIKYDDDTDAIKLATTGTSTKGDSSRGYELPTTLKIATKGLKGEALIISRAGGIGINNEKSTFYRLSGPYVLEGTLVSFRFPFTIIP